PLPQTRTSAILDYGTERRVTLSINHHHDCGRQFQDATIRIEGERAAVLREAYARGASNW
ncbi:hypothetical protein B2A_00182, partial [mine drainage metagenome]